jgi:hypothetical protein
MFLRATIFDSRSQLLGYVLPSQPQTGLTTFTAVQACGWGTLMHFPDASAAPHLSGSESHHKP